MSVIQFTVRCTCCKYGIFVLCYSRILFSCSFVCRRCKETIGLLTVSYGLIEAISRQHNKYLQQYHFFSSVMW